MKYDLADRTVAITGAAGGLGADLAKALRTRGARVALLDLNADAVRELADQLGSESVARGWRADVSNFDDLDQVMTEVNSPFPAFKKSSRMSSASCHIASSFSFSRFGVMRRIKSAR